MSKEESKDYKKVDKYMVLKNRIACLRESIQKREDQDFTTQELMADRKLLLELDEKENKLYQELVDKNMISEQIDRMGVDVFLSRLKVDNVQSVTLTEAQQKKLVKEILRPESVKNFDLIYRNGCNFTDYGRKQVKKLLEGWKKVQENKTFDVRFRVTESEKEKLMENAKHAGYTNMSEYLRNISCGNELTNNQSLNIVKYELSGDLRGLLAYTDANYVYHIHSDELNPDQKIIHNLLMREKVLLLEKLTK